MCVQPRSERKHIEDQANISERLEGREGAGRKDDGLRVRPEDPQERGTERQARQNFSDDPLLANPPAKNATELDDKQNDNELQENLSCQHRTPSLEARYMARARHHIGQRIAGPSMPELGNKISEPQQRTYRPLHSCWKTFSVLSNRSVIFELIDGAENARGQRAKTIMPLVILVALYLAHHVLHDFNNFGRIIIIDISLKQFENIQAVARIVDKFGEEDVEPIID